jgi:prolyl-tRNA synthetase
MFDDRDARPGVKFADDELIGIPHRLVVGDKGLERGAVEYKSRVTGEGADVPIGSVVQFLKERSGASR